MIILTGIVDLLTVVICGMVLMMTGLGDIGWPIGFLIVGALALTCVIRRKLER